MLISCAPGLNTTMRVSEIPASEKATKNLSGVRVKVGLLEDLRPDEIVGYIDGRSVRAEGDISQSVQQAIERQLKIQGARLGLFSTPLIRGSVQEWKVKVYPGFPTSKADAVASLRIELADSDAKKIFASTYTGNMSVEHPMLNRDKAEGILGGAMQNAIDQALADRNLVDKLIMASDSAKAKSPEDFSGEQDGASE